MADERGFSLKLTNVEICDTRGTSVVSMDFVLISKDLWADKPLNAEVMTRSAAFLHDPYDDLEDRRNGRDPGRDQRV